jgi:transcriptional regulator with XRE-family HTH domain
MKKAVIQLKAMAEKRGKSLNEISRDTGISYGVVNRYANNTSKGIQLDDLAKLAEYLKVSVAKLIILEDA